MITLRCRKCNDHHSVKTNESDPEGTTVVECLCPECDDPDMEPMVLYFNSKGRVFDGENWVRSR